MADAPFVVLGAGGHGAVVLGTLLDAGAEVKGLLDPGQEVGARVLDTPVLGPDAWLAAMAPADVVLANGLGAVPGSQVRMRLYDAWRARGFGFPPLVHPSAVLGRDVRLAEGAQVMAGAVVQCRTYVGENVVVNTRASVDHDCHLAEHVFVGPGAVLCGDVYVGRGAFIGAGAVLLPGVEIGAGVVVGAGAVVTRSYTNLEVVMGNPARPRATEARP